MATMHWMMRGSQSVTRGLPFRHFAGMLLATLVLFGVFGGAASAQQGSTLIIAQETDIVTMDLASFSGTATIVVSRTIYEHLVVAAPDGSHVPVLATGWTVSDDLRTWTFELRQGVLFHDGTSFDAAAVVWNFDRLMNPEQSTVATTFNAVIDTVDALDEHTVRFSLKVPRVSFIDEFISETRGGIMSPTAVESLGQAYGASPVGTGPFRFVEWIIDDRLVVGRFHDYWGAVPQLERVVFRPIPDGETRMLELERGGVHVATQVPPEHVSGLRSHPNIRLVEDVTFNYRGIYFNVQRPPFDQVEVRRAIAHAIDVDTIVAALGGDLAVRAQGPVYLRSWALDDSLAEPQYDPQLSMTVLEEAGWTRNADGVWTKDGVRLEVAITTPVGRYPNDLEMIEAAANYLREVGIDARARPLEWATFLATLRQEHNFDMALFGIGPRPPDPALTPMTESLHSNGRLNFGRYTDPTFDALLDQAAATADEVERKRLYVEAQRFVQDNYWTVNLYNEVGMWAIRNEVQGLDVELATLMLDLSQTTID